MISDKFVLVGALLNLWGMVVYAMYTLQGKVKPNRVSFFLWSLAPLIAFAAEINKGVGLRSLMTFMVGFSPLVIFVASFLNKKSVWKLGRFDFTCGALSLVGLGLWLASGEGNVAIAFSIAADGLAALPTIVKSYKAPETESWFLYLLSAISAGITLLTIDKWTFANWGFPMYILLVCLLISSLVRFEIGKELSPIGKT